MYKLKPMLHERQKNHRPGNLRTIALDTTTRCGMACPKCYAETFRDADLVPLDVLERTFDEAYEMGVFHYVLQGGEPLDDLERLGAILKICHPEASYINLVSNGWSMTPERIAWLKELQVDKITFSLDSGIAEEHDAGRMPDSHRRVLQAVDRVLESGLLTGVSCVVTHKSLYSEGFRRAYAYAMDKRIRLDVQIAEPVGKWDGRRDLLITPEDAAHIRDLHRRSPPLPNGQDAVRRDLYDGDRDVCPAGTEFMGVTATGEFLPCNFLQYSLGNIRHRSLTTMRNELLANAWFSDEHPYCIIGENHDFISRFVTPHIDRPKPLNAHEVFQLPREEPGS